MNERLNIWHLVGSTSTILIFLFVGYGKLIATEQQTKENEREIEILKKETRNIDKILIILETMKEDIKEVKAANQKFKEDIGDFYQLNPTLKNPKLK
jgi:Tfp pilus assembly protein PilN